MDIENEVRYRKKLQQNADIVPLIIKEDANIITMNHEAEHVGRVGLEHVQMAFAALGLVHDGR